MTFVPPTPLWYPPVRPLVMTSGFKTARRPDHPGCDFSARPNAWGNPAPLYAVADGVVARSYFSANDPAGAKYGDPRPEKWPEKAAWPRTMGFGETVVLATNGIYVRYAHLLERLVEEGASVVAGQIIGLAGSTGWSSAIHLHMEVRPGGMYAPAVDPMPYLLHLNPTIV